MFKKERRGVCAEVCVWEGKGKVWEVRRRLLRVSTQQNTKHKHEFRTPRASNAGGWVWGASGEETPCVTQLHLPFVGQSLM